MRGAIDNPGKQPMILHASITADVPAKTAALLARLLAGEAFAFPQLAEGAWLAVAGDGRARAIEVLPRGAEFRPVAEGPGVVSSGAQARYSGFHLLIETALSEAEVRLLAGESGLPIRRCARGPFEVLELWIDGCTMLEVIGPELSEAYSAVASLSVARAMLVAQEGAV
jgi:hypothetical protein